MARRHITSRLSQALLLACLPWSLSAAELSPYRATYGVLKSGSEIARSTYELRVASDQLHFSQATDLSGFVALFRDDSIRERSDITIAGDDWQHMSYNYVQTGDSKPRDMQFDTRWSSTDGTPAARITGRFVDRAFNIDTGHEIWDPLSILLALRRDHDPARNNYDYGVIYKGQLKPYRFVVGEQRSLQIDDSSYDAIPFTRTHGKRKTIIWLSPSHDMIPVRIEQFKDDELNTRMDLLSLSGER